MRCPFCENENPASAERCASCGAALTTIAGERDDNSSSDNPSSGNPYADNPNAGNPYTAPQTVSAREESIHELLAAGRKIEAIKLYREQTGAGLKEAKDAVEAIERGERSSFANADFERQLEQLLRQQQKINAIKLYRQHTGVGLVEAKDAVEAFAAPPKTSAAGTRRFSSSQRWQPSRASRSSHFCSLNDRDAGGRRPLGVYFHLFHTLQCARNIWNLAKNSGLCATFGFSLVVGML